MPGAHCTRSLVWIGRKHTSSHYGRTAITRHSRTQAARRANHHTARANSARVPDAVQRASRCSAEPGPTAEGAARWTPDQQRTAHGASKTRVNALKALRNIRLPNIPCLGSLDPALSSIAPEI
jgi:hypothetical protein